MRRPRPTAAPLGAVLLALVACGGGAEPFFPTPDPDDLVGGWALATVNGRPLPAEVPTTAGGAPVVVRVTGSTLTLTAAGRYAFAVEAEVRPVGSTGPGSPGGQPAAGRYQLAGRIVALADTTGAPFGTTPRQAQYDGGVLRVDGIAGTRWEYRRP